MQEDIVFICKRSIVGTFLAPKKSEIITLKKLRFFKGAKTHG